MIFLFPALVLLSGRSQVALAGINWYNLERTDRIAG